MEIRIKKASVVLAHPAFAKEGPHQAILSVAYDEWKRTTPEFEDGSDDVTEARVHSDWSYSDMLMWVNDEFGEFAALMVMLGKMNQQVMNNGWSGYFGNEYGGAGDDIFQQTLNSLCALRDVQTMGFKPEIQKVIDIINGVGEIRDEEELVCPHCQHSLEQFLEECNFNVDRHNLFSQMDKQYGATSEEFMAALFHIAGAWFEEEAMFPELEFNPYHTVTTRLAQLIKSAYITVSSDSAMIAEKYLVQFLEFAPTTIGIRKWQLIVVTNQFTGKELVASTDDDVAVEAILDQVYEESAYMLEDEVKARIDKREMVFSGPPAPNASSDMLDHCTPDNEPS